MKNILTIPISLLFALLAYYPTPLIAAPRCDTNLTPASIGEKLRADFQNSYPNAERVRWEEKDAQYVVSFVNEGILSHIVYDSHGNFAGCLRKYGEQQLPYYLTSILRKQFRGEKIIAVTEISSRAAISYYVKLESDKFFTTVGMNAAGEYGVTESYRKAD